ncbi:MAG: FkbM family methyltransferase [Bacteroidota bacterium]
MFWFLAAKAYIKLYELCRRYFGVTLKGIGFAQRMISTDHILEFVGKKLYFNHNVAMCYNLLLNGKSNEPETHIFFEKILGSLQGSVIFADVGCNIGEMIVDVARYRIVSHVIGFEPNSECVKACRRTVELNNYAHVKIIEKALSADGQPVSLFSDTNPLAASIAEGDKTSRALVPATTLDNELMKFSDPAVILIDVEGAEPLVLRGGMRYISLHHPLIIFEYNEVSRKFFTLDEIRAILGERYALYRLRQDGLLDSSFELTWNCVAVPSQSIFYEPCQRLLNG